MPEHRQAGTSTITIYLRVIYNTKFVYRYINIYTVYQIITYWYYIRNSVPVGGMLFGVSGLLLGYKATRLLGYKAISHNNMVVAFY